MHTPVHSPDYHMISNEIDNAPHGSKEFVTSQWAARLGWTPDKLRRMMRKNVGKKKESPKVKNVSRELAYMVMVLKEESKRYGNGRRTLTTQQAINILIDRGIPGAENLVASTVDRIIRDELGGNDKPSYVRYECDYALQEVQVDYSFSKHFRVVGFDAGADQWRLKATSKALDYKKEDRRMRVLIGGKIDSFSRLCYHHALIGTGESAELCLDFLTRFFNRPANDGLIFREVAWQYRADNGPLDSNLGKTFFSAIDTQLETITPGQSTSLGKVERVWQEAWRWELDLAMRIGDGGTILLDHYNQMLFDFCVSSQYERHPTRKTQRKIDLYQQSLLRQNPRPSTIDIDLRRIAYKAYERTVNTDQSISIDNQLYRAPVMAGEYRTTGRRIRVLMNREGRLIGELIDRFAPRFELEAFTFRSRGDFTGTPPKTARQLISDDLKAGRIPAAGNLPLPEPNTQPNRLMPPGKPADIQSPFMAEDPGLPEQFPSRYEAMQYVSGRLKRRGISMSGELIPHFEECVINESLQRAGINAEIQAFLEAWQETINQTGT